MTSIREYVFNTQIGGKFYHWIDSGLGRASLCVGLKEDCEQHREGSSR